MNKLVYFISLFICISAAAQQPDFLLLKKKDKTIARFFAGSEITFTSTTGASMTARIQRMKNDTLYLKEYIVRSVMTQLGVYILDTVRIYDHQYNYKQIYSMGKTEKGLNMSGTAASLMGGGLLLTIGSGVVYLVDREKFSPPLLIASASLAGLGYLIAKTSGKGMVIGKKYQLVYMGLDGTNKM
ncbi:MAG: hypothetical protein Q7T76_05795 [Ferruginibacter sp.]|nr:hypothetical protein [Ferruginibacter sp.]